MFKVCSKTCLQLNANKIKIIYVDKTNYIWRIKFNNMYYIRAMLNQCNYIILTFTASKI